MLSRRSIRVKVAQVLYAFNRDEELTHKGVISQYNSFIENAYVSYLFILLQIIELTKIAREDEEMKKAKFIKSEEDLSFTPKLSENKIVLLLESDANWKKLIGKYKIRELLDGDITRKLYAGFSKIPEYKQYLKEKNTDDYRETKILLDVFRYLRSVELFEDVLSDRFLCWEEDRSLVVGAVKRTIKTILTNKEILSALYPNDETVKDFGEKMLNYVIENETELSDLIRPNLNNWEPERVAVMDMVFLKLALAEFLNFPTIPTKVTLNEYVELSKLFSTDKSKEFVNGILDKLLKKLIKNKKVNKKGRGLLE